MSKGKERIVDLVSQVSVVLCMTLVITTVNTGVDSELWLRWMRSFSIAFPVLMVVQHTVMPSVRHVMSKALKLK